MLTRLRERQRTKAHCYWPSEGETETFGTITVQALSTKPQDHYVIRKFSISYEDKQRTIYQIQYTDWPDFGVPASSQSILDLLETIEKHRAKFKVAPSKKRTQLLFHCSAGIGRCGTLLSIYYAIEQLKEGNPVSRISVPDIVCSLRSNRLGMVQTQEQFEFIYKVINDYLRGGSTSKPRKRDLRQVSAPSAALINRRKNRPLRSNRTVVPPKPKKSQTWQTLPVDCTIIDVN